MTPTMELEAKNVEQAIQKACQQLKISRDNLKYNVISYGSTGIFGLGRTKKARIRVTLPGKNPETVSETNDIEHTDLNHNGDVTHHAQSLIQDTFSPKQTETLRFLSENMARRWKPFNRWSKKSLTNTIRIEFACRSMSRAISKTAKTTSYGRRNDWPENAKRFENR
jgi:hypothetical protein